MADLTFLGAGAMGAALARCAAAGGFDCVVWNRSPAKAAPLAESGARVETDLGAAIDTSPVIVVCIAGYEAMEAALAPVADRLAGKVLVQLSTGSHEEAGRAHETATARDVAGYLDGAILDVPGGIGQEGAIIITSGDRNAFDSAEAALRRLAPGLRYLGEDPALASSLDAAALTTFLFPVVGSLYGAALCEAASLPVSELRGLVAKILPVVAGVIEETLQKVEAGEVFETEAPLYTWAPPLEHMAEVAEAGGFDASLPRALRAVFDRALERDLGNHDIAALVQTFRPGAPK